MSSLLESLPTARPTTASFVAPDAIRAQFARAMSEMYRAEVAQYGTLLEIVAEVNARVLQRTPDALPCGAAERSRLDVERHGAIRLGSPHELCVVRRIFAVMGMSPVGYYDLSVAGVPVHSTAFRPVAATSLASNPFRVFTSLLRLELIQDQELRDVANRLLDRRNIFTARALALTARSEAQGGLEQSDVDEFVQEVLQTFRWHAEAQVDEPTYRRLHDAHRLIADVACFKGPHINHLTPRTLDIDAAQAEMLRLGMPAKAVIEGPPARRVPILLRQTSFKALEEKIGFLGDTGHGAHSARFGEIEQRGLALTRKGRMFYDTLLAQVPLVEAAGDAGADYPVGLARAFAAFPDDLALLRRQGLGFFRYGVCPGTHDPSAADSDLDCLVEQGIVFATPITYEDFLPVSAAGIFQSNLDGGAKASYSTEAAQQEFESALGVRILDPFDLYEAEQAASIASVREQLRTGVHP